jgi:hypothetical protein
MVFHNKALISARKGPKGSSPGILTLMAQNDRFGMDYLIWLNREQVSHNQIHRKRG